MYNVKYYKYEDHSLGPHFSSIYIWYHKMFGPHSPHVVLMVLSFVDTLLEHTNILHTYLFT